MTSVSVLLLDSMFVLLLSFSESSDSCVPVISQTVVDRSVHEFVMFNPTSK